MVGAANAAFGSRVPSSGRLRCVNACGASAQAMVRPTTSRRPLLFASRLLFQWPELCSRWVVNQRWCAVFEAESFRRLGSTSTAGGFQAPGQRGQDLPPAVHSFEA